MKLYSGPLSLFSAKARIALGEKGIDHDLVQVDWSREAAYRPHHPDVVDLNPKAQVPVLVDGDVVVFDSTLIFEYLEDRVQEPRLYPVTVADRARCRQQEAAADEIWFPHVWALIEARVYLLPDRLAAADAAAAALATLSRQFSQDLGDRPYWCDAFTVADIATFVFVNAAGALGAPIPDDCTHMKAWRERVAGRPAVRKVVDDLNAAAAQAFAA